MSRSPEGHQQLNGAGKTEQEKLSLNKAGLWRAPTGTLRWPCVVHEPWCTTSSPRAYDFGAPKSQLLQKG